MGYVLINSAGKRVKKKGEITPYFEYPIQASKYIDKYLGGSPSTIIHKIKDDVDSVNQIANNILPPRNQQQGDKFSNVGRESLGRIQQNMRNRKLI